MVTELEAAPDLEHEIVELGGFARDLFPEYNGEQIEDAAAWVIACLEHKHGGKLDNTEALFEQVVEGFR